LPAQPKINTPNGQRPVGAGVMKVIAAHEFIHSLGLENRDHSNDDLFQGNPQVDYGGRPSQDTVLIGRGPRKMPPLILAGATAAKIREAWGK
jgi:hypothetical protein